KAAGRCRSAATPTRTGGSATGSTWRWTWWRRRGSARDGTGTTSGAGEQDESTDRDRTRRVRGREPVHGRGRPARGPRGRLAVGAGNGVRSAGRAVHRDGPRAGADVPAQGRDRRRGAARP